LATAGFDTVGCGFAHGLHTPYWVLRSAMHLPDADDSRLVRGYREFLIRATASRWMDRLEGVLNYVCPKSIILYGEKRAVESNLSKSTEASVSATAAAAA
jgi:hypothetical protein